MNYQRKFMSLNTVIRTKIKRAKETLKDLEILIDDKTASSRQQQEYVKLKAKVEAYEDVLDLSVGMTVEKSTDVNRKKEQG